MECFKLIRVEVSDAMPESSKVAIEWYECNKPFRNEDNFEKYRISDALMGI
jgi:hypothetical protein